MTTLIGIFSIPIAILRFVNVFQFEIPYSLIQIGSVLGITLSVYLARRFFDRRSFKSLGLQLNRRTLGDILVGFLIPAVMMGMLFTIMWALGWIQFSGFIWQRNNNFWLELISALIVFIVVGWQEELFSRGYQLQNLADGLNIAWGVLLSSLFFSLLHYGNPHSSAASILGITLAGLFLAYAFVRTRQLWLPIGLHIGWDFFEGPVFGFAVSGLQTFRLVDHEISGPEIFTGGSFGPEAGLLLIPALGLGVLLIEIYKHLILKS